MRRSFSLLDRYLLRQSAGTLASVFGIVISLMMFEHFARLLDIVSLSGRKTYIVTQSMLALLPEYAGVGLLFGLYLAIALTVRRLSLRGEFDIIQATGISTYRWMRVPALLALLVSALLLLTQGWLMPAGEQRLTAIARQMEEGQFGYALEAGKFTDLGKGITVRFADVDPQTHELRGVFFRTTDTTFTASRGRIGFDLANHVLVDLKDGSALNGTNGETLSFSGFHFENGAQGAQDAKRADAAERRKMLTLPALLSSHDNGDKAAAWSRLLWAAFALVVPFIAAALGKPLRRSSTSLGLMLGVVLLVTFIRSTGFVAATASARPGIVALGTAVAWGAAVSAIVCGERRYGAGFIDQWLLKGVRKMKLPRLFGRHSRRAGIAG